MSDALSSTGGSPQGGSEYSMPCEGNTATVDYRPDDRCAQVHQRPQRGRTSRLLPTWQHRPRPWNWTAELRSIVVAVSYVDVVKFTIRAKRSHQWLSMIDDFTQATRQEAGNTFFEWSRNVDGRADPASTHGQHARPAGLIQVCERGRATYRPSPVVTGRRSRLGVRRRRWAPRRRTAQPALGSTSRTSHPRPPGRG